jgi:hypothetical protein
MHPSYKKDSAGLTILFIILIVNLILEILVPLIDIISRTVFSSTPSSTRPSLPPLHISIEGLTCLATEVYMVVVEEAWTVGGTATPVTDAEASI